MLIQSGWTKALSAILLILLAFSTASEVALAKEMPVRARFYAGSTKADMTAINDIIVPQGLKKADDISQWGLEIAPIMAKYLDLGVRYTKRSAITNEDPDVDSTRYQSRLIQDSILLVARVPFFQSENVRFDVFGGAGGTNTNFSVYSSSNTGELSSQAAKDWYSSPYTAYGASLALGAKEYFFFVEAGVENNKISNFKSEGNIGGTLETLDMGGNYLIVGLLLNGIPGMTK